MYLCTMEVVADLLDLCKHVRTRMHVLFVFRFANSSNENGTKSAWKLFRVLVYTQLGTTFYASMFML